MTAAGIIAAGLGERLAAAGFGVPKPMTPVAGRPLCHWVVSGLRSAGVKNVALLTNSRGLMIRGYLEKAFPDIAWKFLCADTVSSWESFRLVAQTVARSNDRFIMSTVDSLIAPADVAAFAAAARQSEAALALTEFVDDERPLWAELRADGTVAKLGDAVGEKRYVTTGLYALSSSVCETLPGANAFRALREFLSSLVAERLVRGVPLSKCVDLDRPEDLVAAEAFLNSSW